jgi:hypothetical protein
MNDKLIIRIRSQYTTVGEKPLEHKIPAEKINGEHYSRNYGRTSEMSPGNNRSLKD